MVFSLLSLLAHGFALCWLFHAHLVHLSLFWGIFFPLRGQWLAIVWKCCLSGIDARAWTPRSWSKERCSDGNILGFQWRYFVFILFLTLRVFISRVMKLSRFIELRAIVLQVCMFYELKTRSSISKKITTWLQYSLYYGGLEMKPQYLRGLPVWHTLCLYVQIASFVITILWSRWTWIDSPFFKESSENWRNVFNVMQL